MFFLFVPERNPALRQVIDGHLHLHLVAGEYPDVVLTHLARYMGGDDMPIVELYAESSIGECLGDDAILLYRLLLCVSNNISPFVSYVFHVYFGHLQSFN